MSKRTLSLPGSIGSEESVTWLDETLTMYDGMSCQANAVAAYVGEGRVESPVHPHAEVISVMATIDAAREQVAAATMSQ